MLEVWAGMLLIEDAWGESHCQQIYGEESHYQRIFWEECHYQWMLGEKINFVTVLVGTYWDYLGYRNVG